MPYLNPNPLLGLKVGDKVRLASRDKRLDNQPYVIVTVTHINLDGSFLVSGRKYNHYQRDGIPLGRTKKGGGHRSNLYQKLVGGFLSLT